MKGHGEKLSRKEELAIAALLSAPTLAEAAHTAGISEPTLWRWLQREEFQTAYRAARREAVSQAVAHLQHVCGEAVETLRGVMTNDEAPASARVSAAKTVLELSLKATELEDLAARVAALEAMLKQGGARHESP